MASSHRIHCADPHKLWRTEYGREAPHTCDLCGCELAGLIGYRCGRCNFDVHEACADYFGETVSFFAHPWHALELSRIPTSRTGWVCDLCREVCAPGSLVYRCVPCGFDVHPLCTMLPQVIRSSPLHRDHDLHMTPSWGSCGACHEQLPIWHYSCGYCVFKLHIACASGGGQGASATAACQSDTCSGSNQATGTAHPLQQQGGTSQSVVVRRSRSSRVAKFLLEQAFFIAIESATGGLASPVLEILSAAMSSS